MPPQPMQDGFGQEIWAHLETGHAYEIVERDDGYIDATPTTTGYFAPFRRWPTRQKRAMRLIRGKRALDVGCGAGRVALYLQEKGLRVMAIDNSRLAIKVCRIRGVKEAVMMPLNHIARLRLGGRFDTVIMFGNNFGLFGSRAKARELLRELHRLTSSSAVILAETINPYQTDNPFHLKYQARNRRRGRMSGQLRIRIRFQASVTRWFDYLFVSPEEMRDIAQGTGWKLMRIIKDGSVAYIGVLEKE